MAFFIYTRIRSEAEFAEKQLNSYLSIQRIQSLGTVNKGRLGKGLKIPSLKDLRSAKTERGYSEEWVADVNGTEVGTVLWYDNKPVVLSSSIVGQQPIEKLKVFVCVVHHYKEKEKDHLWPPIILLKKRKKVMQQYFLLETAESPILLIFDGHYSHTRNIEIIELARVNHVTIISHPPHTTLKLRPLNKTVMGALKSHYGEENRKILLHSERMLKPYDIAELFGRAYLKSTTGETAVNGFRATGIYSFNPQVSIEVDF
ncbi:hypothetical protein KGM_209435 [Danaus plexippus plexippus]|uniref:DDE-1 domain-containing protein n=1 Tax=Danaus plexippus plexippus TaxID=278856 RepID=A0A212EJH6_DANPL|nr:hypothetical protein KGM_209435 [Danaus plexippus plexippus]